MAMSKENEAQVLGVLIAQTEQQMFAVSMEMEAAEKTSNREWIEQCKKALTDKQIVLYTYREELKKRVSTDAVAHQE